VAWTSGTHIKGGVDLGDTHKGWRRPRDSRLATTAVDDARVDHGVVQGDDDDDDDDDASDGVDVCVADAIPPRDDRANGDGMRESLERGRVERRRDPRRRRRRVATDE